MKTIYLECFAGVSGNMLLGALIDAGLPSDVLRAELDKLGVDGYELKIDRVSKSGISAVYLDVKTGWFPKRHRYLPDIRAIIEGSTLPDRVKTLSMKVFEALAAAEAKVHGTTVDKVHFHEVGAVDTIVDIVGTVVGLEYLGIEKIYVSPLVTGKGFVKCSHGRMPVPAPATAELLNGLLYSDGGIERELVTPTGAALVRTLGSDFGSKPAGFVAEKIAYGAGTWDLDIPNVLRMHLGDVKENPEELLVMETNIDDANPQIYAYVFEKLLQAGVLDVWLQPVLMKKGRPGAVLACLLTRAVRPIAAKIIFEETTTLGVRYYPVEREMLDRKFVTVEISGYAIAVKLGFYAGRPVNIAPEYEDCRKAAESSGLPLRMIREQAVSVARGLLAKE